MRHFNPLLQHAGSDVTLRWASPLRFLSFSSFVLFVSACLPGLVLSEETPFLTPISNLGLMTSRSAAVSSSLVVVSVEEAAHSMDLNADGDEEDIVVQVFDSRTGHTKNLGLASLSFPQPSAGVDLIAFQVSESAQAGLDLNGDGDSADLVLHVYDTRNGRTTNLALATPESSAPIVHGEYVSFIANERSNGARDLNGDGDAVDFPVHVYHSRTETMVNLGVSANLLIGAHRSFLAFSVIESHGLEDLNGDGDLLDSLLHVYDASSGEIRNLGLGADALMIEGLLVAQAGETRNGVDFNGDGDHDDVVLHVYDIDADRLRNIGLDSVFLTPTVVRGHLIVFTIAESLQDQTDLNGDGDRLDRVVFFYDSIANRVRNTGLAVNFQEIEVSGSWLAIRVPESMQGGLDLNGDGDVQDSVVHSYDTLLDRTTNLSLAVGGMRLVDDKLVLAVSESQQGSSDLNGDGDRSDRILFVHDLDSGTSRNLRLSGLPESTGSGSHLLRVSETGSGGKDFNGDGDTRDLVAFHFENHSGRLTNLRLSYRNIFPRHGDLLTFYSDESIDIRRAPPAPPPPVNTVQVLDLALGDRAGKVNAGRGSVEDVLFVNGSAGEGAGRVVEFDVLAPLQIEIRRPSSIDASDRAPYAVYAWLGEPDVLSPRRLPFGLGSSAMPMPLSCGSPEIIWNNAGRTRKLGVPTRLSSPAPDRFFERSRLRQVQKFFVQGLIYDPASAAEIPASVTNGIVARPVFIP